MNYEYYVVYVTQTGTGSVFMTTDKQYNTKETFLQLIEYISREYVNGTPIAITNLIPLEEKQTPKKPIKCTDNGTGTRCPNCNETILTNWKPNYCMFCGQKIDWSKYI